MIKITRKKVVRFLRFVSNRDPLLAPASSLKDNNTIDELGVLSRGGDGRQKSLSWTGGRGSHASHPFDGGRDRKNLYVVAFGICGRDKESRTARGVTEG